MGKELQDTVCGNILIKNGWDFPIFVTESDFFCLLLLKTAAVKEQMTDSWEDSSKNGRYFKKERRYRMEILKLAYVF